MLITIFYAFISVASLGAVFGIGLAIAAKYLHVKKDEKLISLEEIMPGYNCGACGYAGCSSYAEAIFDGSAENLTLCAPGAAETAHKIADIMGVTVEVPKEKMVAQVHCRGGKENSAAAFDYRGIKDCNAASIYFNGEKVCKYGCLGYGSCINVCPVDAISYDEEGLVWVDKDKCIACGKCIDVCPSHVIKMIPYSADYIVACNSNDKGAVVRKACKVGCIGCKMCDKQSPEGGYVIENFLASIDYSKDGDRSAGAEKCPAKCIKKL